MPINLISLTRPWRIHDELSSRFTLIFKTEKDTDQLTEKDPSLHKNQSFMFHDCSHNYFTRNGYTVPRNINMILNASIIDSFSLRPRSHNEKQLDDDVKMVSAYEVRIHP